MLSSVSFLLKQHRHSPAEKLQKKRCTCFSALSSTLYNKGGFKFSTALPTSLRKESLAGRQLGVRTERGGEFLVLKEGFQQQDVDVAPTLVLWSCSHLIYVRIFKIKHYLYPEQTHHEDARKKSLILLVIFNLFDAKFWINFIVLCLHVFPYWTHLQLSQFNPNESKMK